MIPTFVDKSKIPHRPGIYLFYDQAGQVLYVGKAVDLYQRVTSYFRGTNLDLKTVSLVKNIAQVKVIQVFSEIEALILEANLIKKYHPLYNIKLADDKDYLYIKITKEKFPRVLTARKNELGDVQQYFGPFPSSNTVRTTLKKLRKIFPWCNGFSKSRPCFYYHLNLCPGACIGKISALKYRQIIHRLSLFLQGKKEVVIDNLTKEMDFYAKRMEFEKAQSVKKTIEGIYYLTQINQAKVYLENPNFYHDYTHLALEDLKSTLGLGGYPLRIECYDISTLYGKFSVGSLVVLSEGEIDKKWYRRFKIRLEGQGNDVGMMVEIIRRRLKHQEWPKPDLILVDGGRGQVNAVVSLLTDYGWDKIVFGLAKRNEWLYLPGEKIIKLSQDAPALRLLQKIRDEAHRFALSYHRNLRQKAFVVL